jgi:hypothetical protein
MSSLFDKSSTHTQQITNNDYIRTHPELKTLLSEYLQCVLRDQPENVLEYSIQYFSNDVSTNGKSENQMNQ